MSHLKTQYESAIAKLLGRIMNDAHHASDAKDLSEACSMLQQAHLLHASMETPTVSQEFELVTDLGSGGMPN